MKNSPKSKTRRKITQKKVKLNKQFNKQFFLIRIKIPTYRLKILYTFRYIVENIVSKLLFKQYFAMELCPILSLSGLVLQNIIPKLMALVNSAFKELAIIGAKRSKKVKMRNVTIYSIICRTGTRIKILTLQFSIVK